MDGWIVLRMWPYFSPERVSRTHLMIYMYFREFRDVCFDRRYLQLFYTLNLQRR